LEKLHLFSAAEEKKPKFCNKSEERGKEKKLGVEEEKKWTLRVPQKEGGGEINNGGRKR